MRNTFLAAGWLVTTLWACGACTPTESDPPSLLLVTVTGLRSDKLQQHLAESTQLAQLRDSSRSFTHCYSPSTSSLAAHASLLTGLPPWQHGIRSDAVFVLSPNTSTLAENLHQAGVDTAAFLSSSALAPCSGVTRGFETVSEAPIEEFSISMTRKLLSGSGEYAHPELHRDLDQTAQAAADWLKQRTQRFFAWVHLEVSAYTATVESLDEEYHRQLQRLDLVMGSLLDSVRGREGPVVIVLTADRGESHGEGGEHRLGPTLREEVVRVPLWIAEIGDSPSSSALPLSLDQAGRDLARRMGVEPPEPEVRAVAFESVSPLITRRGSWCRGAILGNRRVWFDGDYWSAALDNGSETVPAEESDCEALRQLFSSLPRRVSDPPLDVEPLAALATLQQPGFSGTAPARNEQRSRADRLLARRTLPPHWMGLDAEGVTVADLFAYLDRFPDDLRLKEFCATAVLARPPEDPQRREFEQRAKQELVQVAEVLPHRPLSTSLACHHRLGSAEDRRRWIVTALRCAPWYFPAYRLAEFLHTTQPGVMEGLLLEFDRSAPLSPPARDQWEAELRKMGLK